MFQGTHILGASCSRLCDSSAFLSMFVVDLIRWAGIEAKDINNEQWFQLHKT